jgi:two-component system sensor histidine kinase DesK
LYRVVVELDASRLELAALRVADERRRFSRDVHDVVGRALSTIAVKANLAAALAHRGDARAEAEMLDVARVADDAMTQTRLLASGYLEVSLDQELSGARSLLEHLGVAVTVPESTEDVPPRLREPMALVLREAVTNILHHSDAGTVTITVGPQHVMVRNDGAAAISARAIGGSGLKSLTGRLEVDGGTLRAERRGDHFTVLAQFEEVRP